jgi:DNA-binding transcriptional MerR regulator
VADDELMTIGQFANLSGLSIHALRHYDDVGLLAPAQIDPASGYRRYRRDQLSAARLIRALRWTDLPIEEIRHVIDDEESQRARDVLAAHRRRLERRRDLLTAQIGDVNRFQLKGTAMPAPLTGTRPAQIKIAVDDVATSRAFYQDAFGMRYDVIRRTEDEDYSSFMFGEYGQDGFFLLVLVDDADRLDRPGPSTFGLLVDDLATTHARALAAGGTELVAPRDAQGMPRNSAVKDPSGNWIWLYQG